MTTSIPDARFSMPEPLIFSTHPLHPLAQQRLAGAGRLVVASSLDTATLGREGREADIVIVRAPLPPSLFDGAPRLRAAVRHGAGLDMIPVDAATEAGVLVANVPGVNARTVAEHVIFASIALLRRFRQVDGDLRSRGWLVAREHSNSGADLTGKTMGIVGMGNVGTNVAHIARNGFGLEVIANSRRPESLPDGARFVTVNELVSEADIVVLCCPLTPETTGLISRERIAMMKSHAVLVNVSRGPVIDDDALIEALRAKRVGGAALDVFPTQPLPPDHPYFCFDNVIVTPHMAGITENSMLRMGIGAAEETLRVLAGRLPVNLCNPEVVERYRKRFPA
ncbi:NAD(P)-dependent oxidoreductase [Arvimicrobium flavum]|uniref:NAD(P)-dependent oxidoreductase n=1 Tax=Arvimicrobium flavum TaxID=3393320 RepID=UPI00237A4E48|nr:hydroxyacid dehydrogenase [Mesorhizobium shangrilense]